RGEPPEGQRRLEWPPLIALLRWTGRLRPRRPRPRRPRPRRRLVGASAPGLARPRTVGPLHREQLPGEIVDRGVTPPEPEVRQPAQRVRETARRRFRQRQRPRHLRRVRDLVPKGGDFGVVRTG